VARGIFWERAVNGGGGLLPKSKKARTWSKQTHTVPISWFLFTRAPIHNNVASAQYDDAAWVIKLRLYTCPVMPRASVGEIWEVSTWHISTQQHLDAINAARVNSNGRDTCLTVRRCTSPLPCPPRVGSLMGPTNISFTGEFSPNFDLKNKISTYPKHFSCPKKIYLFFKLPDFYDKFQ
jgi:hypothetical protein